MFFLPRRREARPFAASIASFIPDILSARWCDVRPLRSAFIEDLTEGQITVTLGDLLMPDPRRTRRMLSILIDYMQFSEEASKEVNRAFAAHDKKKAELEARRNAVVQKEHEIATLRSEHEYRKHDENEVNLCSLLVFMALWFQKSAELEQLCQKTRQTVQENASFQIRFQAIAKDISEKTKRIGELESELKSLTIHNEVLTSKLVTSPERLESEVKEAAERKEAAIKEFDVKRFLPKDLRSRLDDELTSLQNLIVKEQDAVKKCDMAFECERDNHVVQLRNYNEQLSTVGCHIAEMRRRLNEVNKENVVVQREIGKLKDSLSAMNRIAEAESIKIAHRFKGVMQKVG
ncbi:unnamed protein product [Toxocara canis]|uniref:Nuf2 domain-containing protein n=1 Tax=Toxocara canis TaxID=6265 RepID=A0A183UL72_TOXCA|nr:unnamed protein product [Toxocara canis]